MQYFYFTRKLSAVHKIKNHPKVVFYTHLLVINGLLDYS